MDEREIEERILAEALDLNRRLSTTEVEKNARAGFKEKQRQQLITQVRETANSVAFLLRSKGILPDNTFISGQTLQPVTCTTEGWFGVTRRIVVNQKTNTYENMWVVTKEAKSGYFGESPRMGGNENPNSCTVFNGLALDKNGRLWRYQDTDIIVGLAPDEDLAATYWHNPSDCKIQSSSNIVQALEQLGVNQLAGMLNQTESQ
ncbi:hypothetical protein KDA00_03845 [Candidatus Saccharibacteria bacterium]|nr:hypothetical protein [Candidatus Saccharibacteria bacterium]